jgi:hypothetical protein
MHIPTGDDQMTDPLTPDHDQPVEATRAEPYTAPTGPDAGSTGPAGSAGTNGGAGTKTGDVFEQIREAVEDFAEKAAPTVRQFSAKAAEIVATAADKAAPLAHKAGEATADASGKLAEKSRIWAAEVRESLTGNDGDETAAPTPTTDDPEAKPPPSV